MHQDFTAQSNDTNARMIVIGNLFFIAIIGYALLIKAIFPGMRIGATFLCAFLGLLASAYVFVILCGFYALAAYALMYGGLALLPIMSVYMLWKRRDLLRQFFSAPAFTVYIVLSLAMIFQLRNATPWEFDSYSFWARAAKELYTTNHFYINSSVNMPHADYHPIFASLQYAITRSFGWKESYLFYVPTACLFIPICALTDGFTRRPRVMALVLTGLFLLLYNVTSITYAIAYLGSDGALGVLFGALAVLWFTRKDDSTGEMVPVTFGLLVLPALKLYSGMLFALVLWFPIFLHFLRARKQASGTTPKKAKWLLHPMIMLVLILFMQISWNGYYQYSSAVAFEQTKMDQAAYLSGEEEAGKADVPFQISMLWQGNPRNAAMNQISAEAVSKAISLTKEGLYTLLREPLPGLPVSFLGLLLLFGIISVAFLTYLPLELKEYYRKTLGVLIVGSVVYTVGVFATYLVQPATSTSLLRYVGVCSNAISLAILYFAVRATSQREHGSIALLCAISAGIVLSCNPSYIYKTYIFQSAMAYDGAVYAQQIIDTRLETALEQTSIQKRILLIDCTYTDHFVDGVVNSYHYLLLPRRVQVVVFDPNEEASTVSQSWLAEACVNNRIDTVMVVGDSGNSTVKALVNILGVEPYSTNLWVMDDVNRLLR